MIKNERRNLFCLRHPQVSCSLIHHVEAAGWQVYHAEDVQRVIVGAKRNDIRVGIVVLTGNEPAEWILRIYEAFNQIASIEWIAVVSEQILSDEESCSFLVSHFLDFHTPPIDPERLLHSIGHAYGMATLLPPIRGEYKRERLIGNSESMRRVLDVINRVTLVDAPVLISGDTGTGKELIAGEIHTRSARRDGPFVVVNCAELPSTLIHAELFGYEKGAFTGATRRKIGYLEQANGGTIFLDEIGDLSIDLQILLLRFLQEKMLRRVGGIQDIKIDAHVIAATHVNLPAAVQERRFREDLYHRLNVLHLNVPPLRDRAGDIEQLAYHFLGIFSQESRINVRGFTHVAIEAMNNYQWPGNVRELMNRVRRALVMSSGRLLTAADLGLQDADIGQDIGPPPTLEKARIEAERKAIQRALEFCDDHVNNAASLLDVSRASMYRLMAKHEMSVSNRKTGVDDNHVPDTELPA